MKADTTPFRILVIEDNKGDLLLLRDFLDEVVPNAVVTIARTFKDVVEDSTSNLVDYDVILLDLTLPDHTGEELIRDVIGMFYAIPVIVLTGFTDLEFGVRSLSLGISDYLLKEDLTANVLYKTLTYAIERGKSNAQLLESEKRYSDMFQLSPIPMWVYDLQTLRCLSVNEAAIANYGFSRTEFLSMTARDVRTPDDIPDLETGLEALQSSAERQTSGTFRHRRKDNTILIVDVRARIIEFNRQPAVLVIAHDTTDRVNYVKTIERQNEALREITWTQSHVVRAPLTRIMSLIELIESEAETPGPYTDYLQHLSKAAQELDSIIRSIIGRTNALESENFGSE